MRRINIDLNIHNFKIYSSKLSFELDTINPDRLILIFTMGTFNLRINTLSLQFSYPFRQGTITMQIRNKENINLQINERFRSSIGTNLS